MQDMQSTVNEYQQSREQIQSRIHELNTLINKSRPSKEDSASKRLTERRSQLYTELWDIEYAIREMLEYLHTQRKREVAKKVG